VSVKSTSELALENLHTGLKDFAVNLKVTRRILVVDDDPAARSLFSNLMTESGFSADVVASAAEALEKMAADDYAVVLTDKNMPGMDGIQLLKKVKMSWPQTEVLIITAYASVESALQAISEGAFDYIPKPPPSLSYVAEKLRGALARYDFEIRFRAMVEFLKDVLLKHQAPTEQTSRERQLYDIMAAYQKNEQGHVVVLGTVGLMAEAVEQMGLGATGVETLEEAVEAVGGEGVHVVLFIEVEGHLDGATVTRALHQANPDVGVFVVARDGDLKRIVDAIGIGVGDYLLRPLEDREMLEPRLQRLVARQQRIERYRYLLNALKKLNIDLATWITWPPLA
jgi:DNA-binding NtrC family response regulator